MPNTCKSNGTQPFGTEFSGERVSNTWVICLTDGDNGPKGSLIPNTLSGTMVLFKKDGDRKTHHRKMSLRLIS